MVMVVTFYDTVDFQHPACLATDVKRNPRITIIVHLLDTDTVTNLEFGVQVRIYSRAVLEFPCGVALYSFDLGHDGLAGLANAD